MPSPFAKLAPTTVGATRWSAGFLADRFRCCAETMVPVMGNLLTETERVRYVGNFEVAIGKVEGCHRGPKWNDGDFYKWLEAAAAVYGVSKDATLDAQMDAIIDLIAKAQAPDGYIHTDVQIAQKAGADVKRFGNPLDFEMYNHGHLITAAVVHYRATGKRNLLDIAVKAADFLDREFAKPQPEQARHGICPAHLMALLDIYRLNGQRKYLELAQRLLNMRDLVTKGDDDNQDRVPFRKQTTAHGHAVRATYLYAGAADVYMETGDESLLAPMEPIWRDLVERKLYITGGCGALFDGASPDGAIDQSQITRIHQAFGRPFQLPQSTSHNETCAAIGNLFWNWRMFLITGEARFADLVEWTLYNSVLAGINLAGDAFFYTNTLRQLDPMPCELRWPRQRQKFMSCFCCPPNIVRVLAQLDSYAYAQSDRGVYVILYGGNAIETTLQDRTRVSMAQETDYPWNRKVRITVRHPGEFSIFLRIPQWEGSAEVRINAGSTVKPQSGTFCELRRAWKAGDVIELDLPMPARIVEANPYVEEARNQVAVARGPIVYCLESADLPGDVRVMDVAVEMKSSFAPCDVPNLPGIVGLRASGRASAAGSWDGQLYRERGEKPSRPIDFVLIPYFAWDNRGPSEMTVWLSPA